MNDPATMRASLAATSESRVMRNVPEGDAPVVRIAVNKPNASSVVEGTPVAATWVVCPRATFRNVSAVADDGEPR